MMEKDLQNNYFDQLNVRQFNYISRNIYFISIGTSRDNMINLSLHVFTYSCPCRSRSLINKFKMNCDRMKMLLKINVMLQDDVVNTPKITNNKVSSNQSSNSKTNNDVNSFRFVKDPIKRKDVRDDSSIS